MAGAGGADLDDAVALDRADPGGMLRAVAGASAQVREAAARVADIELGRLTASGRPRALVCVGMGGSGIVGNVLAAVAGAGCPVPIAAHKGYGLPGWIGGADVVIATSYSGATEETLSGLEEAIRRGCRVAAVGAADSPLQALAERGGGVFVPVPAGRAPRAALWALAVPALLLARELGVLALEPAAVAATADRLEALAVTCRSASESFVNPAKELALRLEGRLPMLWGTSPVTAAAALRLHCQLAENAKLPSVLGELPEAAHNLVVTLDGPLGAAAVPADLFADVPEDELAVSRPGLALLLLRDSTGEERAEVGRRADLAAALAADRSVPVHQLVAEGATRLERLASLVGLTDWVSVYLALLTGVDPTPVTAIEDLKARLAGGAR